MINGLFLSFPTIYIRGGQPFLLNGPDVINENLSGPHLTIDLLLTSNLQFRGLSSDIKLNFQKLSLNALLLISNDGKSNGEI